MIEETARTATHSEAGRAWIGTALSSEAEAVCLLGRGNPRQGTPGALARLRAHHPLHTAVIGRA